MSKVSSIPIYFGDAFTTDENSPFTGNPGAICILEYDNDISDETKQKIANEANLNATAFISLDWKQPQTTENHKNGDNPKEENIIDIKRKIRWFTPAREVPLCGHDTIIAVKVLAEILLCQDPELTKKKEIIIEFDCPFRGILGGVYYCESGRVTLNFPSSPCFTISLKEANWIDQFAKAALATKLTSTAIQDVQYSPAATVLLIRLADHLSPEEFREISPNFTSIKPLQPLPGMIGLILTLKGKNGNVDKEQPHFYSRYFGPWVGFHEDPVCGSAHTLLTPYWANEYKMGFGETLLGRQHSARGGLLYCSMVDNDRVRIGGEAKVLIRGELTLN